MSDETHQGCQVCGRADIGLKRDGTLRHHVDAAHKGSGFLLPGGSRCRGTGHPPQGEVGPYAKQALAVLRLYFSDFKEPYVEEVIGKAIQRHHVSPDGAFEAILDEAANWRLKPDGRDTGRVRLACCRMNERDEDRQLVERVNAALAEITNR